MIAIATTWLALALLLATFSWFAKRQMIAIFLPVVAVLAAAALYVPLGRPIPLSPKAGHYTVLGAKVVPNVAIWVLLDDGVSEPRYYRLKYSNTDANALQQAEDAGNGQPGSVKMQVGPDGGASYDGPPPVSGEPPKPVEQPALNLP